MIKSPFLQATPTKINDQGILHRMIIRAGRPACWHHTLLEETETKPLETFLQLPILSKRGRPFKVRASAREPVKKQRRRPRARAKNRPERDEEVMSSEPTKENFFLITVLLRLLPRVPQGRGKTRPSQLVQRGRVAALSPKRGNMSLHSPDHYRERRMVTDLVLNRKSKRAGIAPYFYSLPRGPPPTTRHTDRSRYLSS